MLKAWTHLWRTAYQCPPILFGRGGSAICGRCSEALLLRRVIQELRVSNTSGLHIDRGTSIEAIRELVTDDVLWG